MRKVMYGLLSLTLITSLVLTGCGNNQNVGNSQSAVKSSGKITVLDLKKKYGSENDKSIMPLYNVPNDNAFKFTFKSKLYELPSDADIVSVYTDSKTPESSKVLSNIQPVVTKSTNGNYVVSVSPLGAGVLPSDSNLNSSGNSWGNAPIYYIKINYDMDATTPTKLVKPIVIPFTVKSELPVPNLRKIISPDGRIKLVWDKVSGAEKYKIYNASKINLLKTTNEKLSGAEQGYRGVIPISLATVPNTTTEWDDFLQDGNHGLVSDEDTITMENAGVNGEYFVTAIAGTKESNFSEPIDTTAMSTQLPLEFADQTPRSSFDNVTDLPKTIPVKYVDGIIQNLEMIYDMNNVQILDNTLAKIYFKVKGTALKSYVLVDSFKDSDKNTLNNSQKTNSSSGFVPPDNKTDSVPAPNVPTIINSNSNGTMKIQSTDTKSSDENTSTQSSTTSENKSTTSTSASNSTNQSQASTNDKTTTPTTPNVVDEQRQNTQKQVDEGNQAIVPSSDISSEVKLDVNSALEEYLALNMIDAKTDISLKAFPEAQNSETLQDVMEKVIYQNPFIIGVKGYEYNYDSLILHVKYDESAQDIQKKQQASITEAKKIDASIITNGMTDEQKNKAIYDYLDKNTKYDNDALKNAEKNNFQSVDAQYNDSFNTYGIMVRKVGVCQSYAEAYKMLSDFAGLKTIVVTGTIENEPHAWNKVKIGNDWLNVDSTNNGTNSGIPYFLYEASDATAKQETYIPNNEYWLDNEINQFASTTDKDDYYIVNGLQVKSVDEYKTKLTDLLKKGDKTIVIRFVSPYNQEQVGQATAQVFEQVAKDKIASAKLFGLANYVMVSD